MFIPCQAVKEPWRCWACFHRSRELPLYFLSHTISSRKCSLQVIQIFGHIPLSLPQFSTKWRCWKLAPNRGNAGMKMDILFLLMFIFFENFNMSIAFTKFSPFICFLQYLLCPHSTTSHDVPFKLSFVSLCLSLFLFLSLSWHITHRYTDTLINTAHVGFALVMCVCVCVRLGPLALDNLSRVSSLENIDSLAFGSYYLPISLHLRVKSYEISTIHVSISAGCVIVRILFR